ncbi:hypothetical protein PAHAL_5G533500 [Panicum hallii]|uniref:Uncharacterized protein n=1 Tax=Panicum hallii TaxID=206008 RepID=A0A2S3HZF7_9POAL|nr:hypothetical protein PAHAL_5G533500 [Panicum hallii]
MTADWLYFKGPSLCSPILLEIVMGKVSLLVRSKKELINYASTKYNMHL